MRQRTHLVLGILVGLLIADYFELGEPFWFILIFTFASILPDIDYKNSLIGRKAKPFSSIFYFLFKHRGFIHTIFIPLIALFILHLADKTLFGIAFFSGYLLHLLSDALDVDGVSLFSPLLRLRISGFLRYNSLFEKLLFLILLILLIVKIYFKLAF